MSLVIFFQMHMRLVTEALKQLHIKHHGMNYHSIHGMLVVDILFYVYGPFRIGRIGFNIIMM